MIGCKIERSPEMTSYLVMLRSKGEALSRADLIRLIMAKTLLKKLPMCIVTYSAVHVSSRKLITCFISTKEIEYFLIDFSEI
jgi:hypothetical protein